MSAFHWKVNWLSGYKTKIPVNKLTFGKQRTTYNKSQTALSLSPLCWVQYTLHVINTECWTSLHAVPTYTSYDRHCLNLNPNAASKDKNTSIHTQTCGQHEMFELTSCTPWWEQISWWHPSVSFCVWADACAHDEAVMLVKLLLNSTAQGSSDSPPKTAGLWRMSAVMHMYVNYT